MNTTQAIKQESATEKRQHGSQTPTPHNIIDQTTQRKRRIMSNSQQRQFTQPPVKRETTAPKTAAQPDANADPDAKSTFGSCDLQYVLVCCIMTLSWHPQVMPYYFLEFFNKLSNSKLTNPCI